MSEPGNNSTAANPAAAPGTAVATTTSIKDVLSHLLLELEAGVVAITVGVIAIFMPQLMEIGLNDLKVIGANFRKFLYNVTNNGMSWGAALADMMTADWNQVEGDAKTVAIDFAEAVATALQKAGLVKA